MSKTPGNGPGDSDTFVVNVQFRQHATWQGTVKWAGQNQEVHFRSVLELLKIMDGALIAKHPEDAAETDDKDA
ncbi:MAG: hypothetical protein GXY32_00065 [Ruminococcaceae bacterium]|nr:hypothetical protein [Oscillospiraceae bacterium]